MAVKSTEQTITPKKITISSYNFQPLFPLVLDTTHETSIQ